MAEEFEWPPLESNPEVFTQYMQKVGMPAKWAVGEIFGFDEELLAFLPQPVLAVIANVERLKKTDDKERGDASLAPDVFYMHQSGTLDNACGIIACIHSLFNNLDQTGPPAADSVLGKHLAATASLTPESRAAALERNTEFQVAHAGAAAEGQSEAISSDQSKVKHHFIAFVLSKGRLLELDGTKRGPLVVAEKCDDVLRGSIAAIKERLAKGEISEQLSMMTLQPNA